MADYRLKRAKITWGAAFANTINFAYRIDNALSGDDPREGSSFDQAPSGVEDAWTVGTDYVLTFDLRYLAVGTVWDGATGVRAWLAAARDKQIFRFYPDQDAGTYIESYLVAPMKGQGALEPDGTRKLTVTIRNPTTEYAGY